MVTTVSPNGHTEKKPQMFGSKCGVCGGSVLPGDTICGVCHTDYAEEATSAEENPHQRPGWPTNRDFSQPN